VPKEREKTMFFYKLGLKIDQQLIGIGCGAHVHHNSIQTSADSLPVDSEAIVYKIFHYFSISTIRTESLKEFCSFAEVEYKSLLCHAKTRWMTLLPAMKRSVDIYDGLKAYFLSIDRCPHMLKIFFRSSYFSSVFELVN
jgi:hypothetical protein